MFTCGNGSSGTGAPRRSQSGSQPSVTVHSSSRPGGTDARGSAGPKYFARRAKGVPRAQIGSRACPFRPQGTYRGGRALSANRAGEPLVLAKLLEQP